MPLNDRQLANWCVNGGIFPFAHTNINQASIDLRWSGRLRTPNARRQDWNDSESYKWYILEPNNVYLLDTLETINMPRDCSGLVLLKTKMGRGATFLGHVGWVDPGFSGTLTFQLHHVFPFDRKIVKEERIVQLVLLRMDEPSQTSYKDTGNYYGQKEPTIPNSST